MVQSYDNNQPSDGGKAYAGAAIAPLGSYATVPLSSLGPSNNLTDPLRNFKFLVRIDHTVPGTVGGSLSAGIGFMSVSGLAATTESIPYREGGMNTTVHQLPGQTSFSPITLQRGVTLGDNSNGPWQWFRQLFDVIAGEGTGPANHSFGNQFRCNMYIDVLEHPVTHLETAPDGVNVIIPVKFRVEVHNAWITSVSFSDLNAGDNAVLVEQMSVVHEGFRVAYAKRMVNGYPRPNDSAEALVGWS